MVQFLPSRGFGAGFTQAFPEAFNRGVQEGSQSHREEKQRIAESKALEEAGYNIPGAVKNPKLREALLETQGKAKTTSADLLKNKEQSKTIGKYFGEQAAELYPHLTEGGKTKLFEELLNGKVNNIGTEQILGKYIQENPEEIANVVESISKQQPQTGVSEIERTRGPSGKAKVAEEEINFPQIDIAEGVLPKQIPALKKEFRKENVPVFQETNSKIKALKSEDDHLKILESLSDKVPEGIGRLFINKQGHIRPFAQILKLVPPESERFVKTVNDFISGAKEIFGARVTNFDLQTFQSRLPTLINSKEGRKQIIDQMKTFNEIERNYYDALKKIYGHYGLSGISQEKAEELANQMIEPREKELRSKLISEPEQQSSQVPEGFVLMIDPQGNELHVPQNEVEKLQQLGARAAQ